MHECNGFVLGKRVLADFAYQSFNALSLIHLIEKDFLRPLSGP